MKTRVAIILLILIIFLSCKTQKKLQYEKNLVSEKELVAENILDSISRNALDYNTLFMKFSASVNSEKAKMNSTGSIKIFKDSLIIFSLTPMLGIELMRAKVTKNEIVVLNRLNKTYYKDSLKNLQKLFGVSLSFDNFEKILTNKIFTYPDSLSIKKDYKFFNLNDNNKTFLQFNYSGIVYDSITYKHFLQISEKDKNYNSFTIEFVDLKKTLNLSYDNFKNLENTKFPYIIDIETIDGKYSTRMNIEFSKIEKNKNLNFSFSIPKRYKRKKILLFDKN